jgi:hyperosmotically inducible protein
MRVGLVGVGIVAAWTSVAPARAEDGAIQERVQAELHKSGVDRNGDVAVAVDGKQVTLSGFVTTVATENDALKAARKVSKDVVDSLRVVPEQERPDADIAKDVQKAILRYPKYTIFDSVSIGVDQGVLRLEGSVLQPYRKDDIANLVSKIPGIRKIDDQIWVQRVSGFDADLRRELSRAIYRNNLFDRYAFQANPPIHIVVDGGKVTLTGVVATPLEQAALGHIARQSMAFSVDNKVEVEGPSVDKKPAPQGPYDIVNN